MMRALTKDLRINSPSSGEFIRYTKYTIFNKFNRKIITKYQDVITI